MEQLLVDDSIEAVQTTAWETKDGESREFPSAHTVRLPQHSVLGLTEEDLTFISEQCVNADAATHVYIVQAKDGRTRSVDHMDSTIKCMLDMMPPSDRTQVLLANPEA